MKHYRWFLTLGALVSLALVGCPPSIVPDVVGMTQEAAEAAIVAAGFSVGAAAEEYSDTVPAGEVISQDPAAGAHAEQGSVVALVVSIGPELEVQVIEDTNLSTETGLTDGGVTRQATQMMTGTVPNPAGPDATEFEGSVFLVLNGDKIPVSVVRETAKTGQVIYKNGQAEFLNDADRIAPETVEALSKQDGASLWVFQVTFSVNAGPNTLRVEVYDLEDSLYARTEDWDIIGAVEPTSVVITLWWDTNQTDIDLHVKQFDEEGTDEGHCYYANRRAGAMELDFDDVNGFGPEHVTVPDVVGHKRFVIRVYYYADHNDSETTTPTPVHITAEVNGENELSVSSVLSSESTNSSWTTGAHVWEAGEVEASGANVYTINLAEPDLSAWPTVKLTMNVMDEEGDPVDGLTADNIYVINSGTAMSPITVAAAKAAGGYSLTYTDITAGKRDLYVYIYKAAQNEGDPSEGGLSNVLTYGKNYGVLVGLNEYPAASMDPGNFSWVGAAGGDYVNVTVTKTPDGPGDFTLIFTDTEGGTNRPEVSVTPTAMVGAASPYRLNFTEPANYDDYDRIQVKYKKQSWLQAAVKDVTDIKTALTGTSLGQVNNMWTAADFTTYTNAAAKEATIIDKIKAIGGVMKKYDLFYFHFSGHGANGTTDGTQYLCAYEDANWISVTDLSAALATIPKPGATSTIANVIIGIDACHSGNFIDMKQVCLCDDPVRNERCRNVEPQADTQEKYDGPILTFQEDLKALTGNNLFVMTAVPGTHSAWDDTSIGGAANPGGNGVFTYYLKQGISTQGKFMSEVAANTNHDTWVTAEEAFAYLDPKANARVTTANGFPAGAAQDPQVLDNSTSSVTRLVYNW